MSHTHIRLLFLWQRAAEDAFENGVFDFVRVGGRAYFADAVDPPLPFIRLSSLEGFRTTRQVERKGGEEDRMMVSDTHHLLLTHLC